MQKQKKMYPVEFGSSTLMGLVENLDDNLMSMENEIVFLRKENDKLRKENFEMLNKRVQEGNAMIAQTLMACVAVPSLDALGPVGATMIARIRDMKTIEQVKAYINELTSQKLSREKESV